MEYSKVILAATTVILVLFTYLSVDESTSDLGTAKARTVPNPQADVSRNLYFSSYFSSFKDPRSVASKSLIVGGNAGAWGGEQHEPFAAEVAINGGKERAWPASDTIWVLPGTYSHRPTTALLSYQSSQPIPNYGRVLLYITSHFPPQHKMFLQYCWKNVLARSPLLQGADVAVHLNPSNPQRRKGAMDLLREVFADHDLTVYVRTYEGALLEGGSRYENEIEKEHRIRTKQTGAVMAMYEGVRHGYFEGYDWVIRVNPDVLVRDDSFFRQAMADPALSALIVNCGKIRKGIHLHTDFFVVRPEVLLKEEFPKKILSGSAENSFSTSIMNTVLKSNPKNYAWIPGAAPASKAGCRVGAGGDYFETPVVHEHALHPNICTVPEGDLPIVKLIFRKPWPESWKMAQYDRMNS